MQRTKAGEWLIRGYWLVLTSAIPQVETSVADTRATFNISNRREYKRITDFGDEEPVLTDLLERMQSDDIFFDIGANVGLFSCLAGQKLSEGYVVSFEPHPRNLERLRENMKMNDISGQVLPYALSDAESTESFNIGEDEPGVGKAALSDRMTGQTSQMREVQTIPGDKLIDQGNVPFPTVLKIDVEGAEARVLRGLQKVLSDPTCRLVYCEIHHERLSEFGTDAEEVRGLLEESGFQLSTIYNRDSTSFIRAEKP